MAGILDNKSRLIDTIITDEGKRQLVTGKMRVEYVSFTDAATYYEADIISGSSDASNRLFFEAMSSLHDAVAFETDDSGLINSNKGLVKFDLKAHNGKLIAAEGAENYVITGSLFASSGSRLIASSIENFNQLRIIGTSGVFENDTPFILSVTTASFTISDTEPIPLDSGIVKKSIDTIGDLFSDRLLSHMPNFAFLPPINEPAFENQSPIPLGSYLPLGPKSELPPEQLIDEIKFAEKVGNSIEVEFSETSLANNIFAQFFELQQDALLKLDVIDYGTFMTQDSPTSKHAFFLGRVFTNSYGVHTFVHLFTLVFYDKIRPVGVF